MSRNSKRIVALGLLSGAVLLIAVTWWRKDALLEAYYLQRLDSANEGVRAIALIKLTDMSSIRALPRILRVQFSGELEGRFLFIIDRVSKMGAKAVAPVIGCAREAPEDKDIQMLAINILDQMRTRAPEAVTFLADRVSDPAVGLLAMRALGDMGPVAAEALPKIVDRMNDKRAHLRAAVVQAVARIDPEGGKAVPVLINALQDDSPGVRLSAVRGLGTLGARAQSALGGLRGIAAIPGDEELRREAGKAIDLILGRQDAHQDGPSAEAPDE